MRILDQLLGRAPSTHRTTELADLDKAGQIVGDYAQFLETSTPLPGRLADVSELPYDKQTIKNALGDCISGTGDPELIEQLKYGYLMLCAWQPGIGDQHVGVDFSSLDLEAAPGAVARQIEKQAQEAGSWSERILRERKEMAFDLLRLGV